MLEQRDLRGVTPAITDEGHIVGLAIPFGQWTTIGSGARSFRERVAPGATTKTLSEGDVVYLDNHNPEKPIARTSAGTLTLKVTTRGVEYDAQPNDTTYAQDLVKNVRAKNIQGNSFGFEMVKEAWAIGDDGVDERTILELKLPEISACTFPAYEQTNIGMRDAYDRAIECRDRYYESRAGNKPYGDVAYADPGYQKDKKKRYPIDTKKHVKAAWSYINKAKNAAAYTAAQVASIKSKIKAAAAKFGVKISSDRSFANFELRGYTPEFGFREAPVVTVTGSDYTDMAAGLISAYNDLSEDERAALPTAWRKAIEDEARASAYGSMSMSANDPHDPTDGPISPLQHAYDLLCSGNFAEAEQVLRVALSPDQAEDNSVYTEDSGGMTAHTVPAGAKVPVRTAERLYDLIRSLPPTAATNEALAIMEPLLSTPDEEREAESEAGTSTSEIEIDSPEGLALQKRMRALKDNYRP